MSEAVRRRIDVSTRTFVRGVIVIALVWLWLRLWWWLLVVVVAVFLAVALDPAVRWMEARGLRRGWAAPLLVLGLVALVGGFFAVSGASLVDDARMLGGRVGELRATVWQRVPEDARGALGSVAPSGQSLSNAGRALVSGVAGFGLAVVLTLYLLLDGRRTYEWLVAFVPHRMRGKVHDTADGAREAVVAYVRGNLVTSALATLVTWVALALMQVPAALLLAFLAGVLNLVPVVGLLLSAAPAVLLALAVSPAVALGVAAFYIGYNIIENYFIQPKVYGRQLRLSDLTVILAFLVGAELGGVLGAIVALPLAAMYPVVERVWLRQAVDGDLAAEHRAVATRGEH
jgi:predicted PurR-regulated permease PerM